MAPFLLSVFSRLFSSQIAADSPRCCRRFRFRVPADSYLEMLRDAAIRGDVAAVQNILAEMGVDVNAALKVRYSMLSLSFVGSTFLESDIIILLESWQDPLALCLSDRERRGCTCTLSRQRYSCRRHRLGDPTLVSLQQF